MPRPLDEQVVVTAGASSRMALLAARNARDLERAAAEIRREGGRGAAGRRDAGAGRERSAGGCV